MSKLKVDSIATRSGNKEIRTSKIVDLVNDIDSKLDTRVDKLTEVTAGTGLTGGGSLESNIELGVDFGDDVGTVAEGNDPRIINGQTAYDWNNHDNAGYAYAATVENEIQRLEYDISTKLDAGALSSNLTYFMTTADSDIPGYYRLVTDVHDNDFNEDGEIFTTPELTPTETNIANFITDNGTKEQHHDNLILTVSGAMQLDSASTANAMARFEVWVRQANGDEYIIGESNWTHPVNIAQWVDYHANAIIPHVEFVVGDRLVIKYFAKKQAAAGTRPKLKIRVGGDDPMRALLPLPITALLPDFARVATTGNYNDLLDKPSVVSQNEAEGGTNTTIRMWSAQRVRQAIEKWWGLLGTAFGRDFVNMADETAGRNKLGLGTAAVKNVGTSAGNILEVDGGNAGSATKLKNARTIAISGAVTGNATSFDGTSNITINTTGVDASGVSGTLPSNTYTDTKYTAGNGLSLTGTSFNLPVEASGDGTYISNVEQTPGGIKVTKGTPPNTIYNAGNGLSLSGTTFSLPVSITGNGNAIVSVTQNTNGITVTKGNIHAGADITVSGTTLVINT